MRNLTPVILQAGLKEALTEGGIVEAHCVEDAKKVGNIWQGNWRIYLRCLDAARAEVSEEINRAIRDYQALGTEPDG